MSDVEGMEVMVEALGKEIEALATKDRAMMETYSAPDKMAVKYGPIETPKHVSRVLAAPSMGPVEPFNKEEWMAEEKLRIEGRIASAKEEILHLARQTAEVEADLEMHELYLTAVEAMS